MILKICPAIKGTFDYSFALSLVFCVYNNVTFTAAEEAYSDFVIPDYALFFSRLLWLCCFVEIERSVLPGQRTLLIT